MSDEQKQLIREKFQAFADSILWSNDDGSEKYIAVGNMADWWLNEIDLAIKQTEEGIVEKIEQAIGNLQYPDGADYVAKDALSTLKQKLSTNIK